MSGAVHAALSRAFSFVSERCAPPFLEALLSRIAWELKPLASPQCLDIAIVTMPRDGPAIVGRSSDDPPLPSATIVGIAVEAGAEGAPLRVKDHAIDSARLVSAGCRSSIVAKLSLPEAISGGGESWLWMGLVSVAAPSHTDRARELAQAICEWAAANSGAVCALERVKRELLEAQRRLRAATAAAHDARAPLGAMRAMLKDSHLGPIDAEVLRSQFGYLQALLERLSPRALAEKSRPVEESDVCAVARRLAQRLGAAVSVKTPSAPIWCEIVELEIERALSNLVGNALSFSGQGPVVVEVLKQPGSLAVTLFVRDSGPGFSQEVLARFAARQCDRLPSATGWGIGLTSARASIEESGGSIRLLQGEEGGGLVEVTLRGARGESGYRNSGGGDSLQLEGARASYGEFQEWLCVVDDDFAHAESLVKLLGARGISARSVQTVSEALREASRPGVRLLCDAQMPDGGAEQLLESLQKRNLKRRVCVMSGVVDDEMLYRLAALGAESFLQKPIESPEVESWLALPTPAW